MKGSYGGNRETFDFAFGGLVRNLTRFRTHARILAYEEKQRDHYDYYSQPSGSAELFFA